MDNPERPDCKYHSGIKQTILVINKNVNFDIKKHEKYVVFPEQEDRLVVNKLINEYGCCYAKHIITIYKVTQKAFSIIRKNCKNRF